MIFTRQKKNGSNKNSFPWHILDFSKTVLEISCARMILGKQGWRSCPVKFLHHCHFLVIFFSFLFEPQLIRSWMDIGLRHQNWREDTAHTIVIFLYFWKGTTFLIKVSLVQLRCDGCKVYDSMKLEESRRFFHPGNFFFTPGYLQVMLNVAKLVCGQAPTFVQLQLLKLRLTSLSSRSNTGLVVFGTRYSLYDMLFGNLSVYSFCFLDCTAAWSVSASKVEQKYLAGKLSEEEKS